MHRQSKLQRYYKVVSYPHRLVNTLTPTIMIALYILSLITIAFGETNENGADNSNELNITTLYPVENLPFYFKGPKVNNVIKITKESSDEPTDIATSKHNKYTHSDLDEEYKTINTDKPIVLSSNESKISDVTKDRRSEEDNIKSIRFKEGTTWRIDATYAPSKVIEGNDESQSRDVETEDKAKAFKPSPHLGSFYDEDSFVVPTPVTEGFTPYKPPSFGSFEKDFYKLSYKGPVDSYQTPIDPPYRFENAPRTADWHSDTRFEARPTMEPSEKIPAGGLYKLPDAFQEKPSTDGNNPNFGLEFKGQKDNSVKQSGNPWKSFLHMVTALVPVGLIVSALTPNVITLENTGNNNPYSRVSRRSDQMSSSLSPQASSPPRISERCKRRLLCELHADQNYISNLSFSQRKPCYKLRCEDPYAMNAVLRWLLDTRPTPGYRPGDHDRRGYIVAN